ncbi:MAG TPA: hypothetical protein VK941_04285 [Gillisia sp.]|nr:hypothetical protein [Gillisia sp.]
MKLKKEITGLGILKGIPGIEIPGVPSSRGTQKFLLSCVDKAQGGCS